MVAPLQLYFSWKNAVNGLQVRFLGHFQASTEIPPGVALLHNILLLWPTLA